MALFVMTDQFFQINMNASTYVCDWFKIGSNIEAYKSVLYSRLQAEKIEHKLTQ